MGKLNTAKLRTLTKPGVYGDGAGLYLQVREADRRTWIYRFTLHGKARWMGLGSLLDVSLAEARDAAAAARKQVKQGTDPIDTRRVVRADEATRIGLNMFADVAAAYIAAHEASWRNPKHRQQWRNTLDTYAAPILGKMSVAQLDTGAVMRVLEPIWREKTETAARVRGRIEAVLDYATARGWRTGENPARWRGHLDNLLPAKAKVAPVEHHPALPWREIGAFMAALKEQDGVGPLALQFLVLTATRTNEALGARWSEIDLNAAIWTVPAERMKAGRDHRVPLSSAALEVLTEVAKCRTDQRTDAPVFPGGKPGRPLTNMVFLMLLRRMGRADLTAHGFRSSFRDWCAESTNYPREVAEAALAHVLKDKTEAAYQRGDLLERRRRLMEEWGGFCTRPPATGEITPLRMSTGLVGRS